MRTLPRTPTRRIVEYLALSRAETGETVRAAGVRADALAIGERTGYIVRAHAALALVNLAKEGKLERVSHGVYVITPAGRDALAALRAEGDQAARDAGPVIVGGGRPEGNAVPDAADLRQE